MTSGHATTLTARSSSQAPLYDHRLNPPYLVDYTSVLSGKRVAATKRRVRFRFGFSNKLALASGATGMECRGCEHDVTLVWSHTSGKRLVVADGKEVHFSVGKPTQGKFEHAWSMRGGHTLKLVAHASPPLKAPQPEWKQFDLQLDGMSVFDMPRIYELGTKAGGMSKLAIVSRNSRPDHQPSSYSNYSMPKEDEMAWARSVETYEGRRNVDRPSVVPSHRGPPGGLQAESSGRRSFAQERLREFGEKRAAAEATQWASAPPTSVTIPAEPPADLVSDTLQVEQDLVSAPPALADVQRAGEYYAHAQDEFALQPVALAPAPTYEDVSASIVAAYGQPPALPPAQELPALPPSTTYEAQTPAQDQAYYQQSPAYEQQQAQPPSYEQQQQAYYQQQTPAPAAYDQAAYDQAAYDQAAYDQQQAYYQQQPATPASGPAPLPFETPDANNYSPTLGASQVSPTGVEAIDSVPFNTPEDDKHKDVDDITRSIKTMVNLEDIQAPPEESLENMREAMIKNPFAEKNVPQSKRDNALRASQPKSTPLPPAGQGWAMTGRSLAEVQAVTREHKPTQPSQEVMKPNAYQGAGGSMVVYGQGPPALQQAQGFGVGAQLQNGGYAATQQQAPQYQQQQQQQQGVYTQG